MKSGETCHSALHGFQDKDWKNPSVKKVPETERKFMHVALELAFRAGQEGETPVGAVVVRDGQIIGSGYNRVEAEKDSTAHAEIIALRQASQTLGDWRLLRTTLYVTLEPCIMCAAALIHARAPRVVFGAWDNRWGGMGSLFDFSHDPRINHEIEVVSGIMEKESAELLQRFFKGLRSHNG